MRNLYSKLDSNEIRLLTPSGKPNGKDVSFILMPFPRNKAPRYTAVSYTWGEGEPTEEIDLNGFKFPVRTNLWSCLHYLGLYAYHSDWKYLWVDAICINQFDNTEKSE
jgi:hypothetical protein